MPALHWDRVFAMSLHSFFNPIPAVLAMLCGLALTACNGESASDPANGGANSAAGATLPHLSPINRPRNTSAAAASSPSVRTPAIAVAPAVPATLTASLSADVVTGLAPLTVHFDASKSVDPLNTPLSFSWNFGDQSIASGKTVQHTYSNPGTYSAVLVTSTGAASATSTPTTITVTPTPEARYSSSLFYVSPAVSAGQTVLLQGSGLEGYAQATVAQVADTATADPTTASFNFPTASALTSSTVVSILQASNTSAKITLPGSLAAGVYALQYQAPATSPAPNPSTLIHAVINVPSIQWWMGRSTIPGSSGSAGYPGQELDVFGRNFGSSPRVWVSSNGTFTPLTVLQSNPYRVAVVLPGSLAAGTYQLWVHNGHGGQFGFSTPAAVAVAPLPAPWPTTQFNVTQFGAKGNGVADDTAAITAALQAAGATGQNGGVVYFPAGQYLVSAKLRVPANTIVAGAGAASTTIETISLPVSNGSIQSLFEGTAHFVIQDLSINSGAADFIITCPASQGMYNFYGIQEPLALGAQCSDVTLQRLSLSHTTLQPVQSNGIWKGGRTLNFQGTDIRILNSVISAQNNVTLFLSEPTNTTIIGNSFLDGKLSDFEIVNSESTVIQGNSISATDPTGNCVGNQGEIHHLYVAENIIHDCLGSHGEAFSADTPYLPYWLGHPTAISGATGSMTFAAPLFGPNFNAPTDGGSSLANRYIGVIVGGAGLGQMKRVTSNSDTTISFESPWLVPPDSTSVIDIQLDKSQNTFYQNQFSNTSVGVQLYSQAYQNVVDGNTGANMGGSYCVANDIPSQASPGGPLVRRFEYCYYNEWLNNNFNGNLADSNINRKYQLTYPNAFMGQTSTVSNFSGSAASVMPRDPLVMFIGNAIRSNQVASNNTIGFVLPGIHPQNMPMSLDDVLSLDLVIEQNTVSSCQPTQGSSNSSAVGIDVYPGSFDAIVSNSNVVSGCQNAIWDSSRP